MLHDTFAIQYALIPWFLIMNRDNLTFIYFKYRESNSSLNRRLEICSPTFVPLFAADL
jgi:hypothetical protein